MSKEAAKAIKEAILSLKGELALYTKNAQNKIDTLESTYRMLTGETSTKVQPTTNDRPQPTKPSKRRQKIDRLGGQKTYEFFRSRGDKPTNVGMVARKFGITAEAASQRVLKLFAAGKLARVAKGDYVDAAIVKSPGNAQTVAEPSA